MSHRMANRGFGSPSSRIATPRQQLTWTTLSARRREDLQSNLRGGGSYLDDVTRAIEADDSIEFTRLLDIRCRGLRAQGLARWDKCKLGAVPDFGKEYIVEPGSSSDKLFHAISKFAGGAELAQWVHGKLWRTQRLLPPKKYTDLCQRHFDWLDADSTSLAINMEQDTNEEDDDIGAGWPPHCKVDDRGVLVAGGRRR